MMTRVALLPALHVDDRLTPDLPAWWPLDPPDATYTAEQRIQLNRARARIEARRGPWDGTITEIEPVDGRLPPTYSHMGADGYVYVRGDTVMDDGVRTVTYRYCPHLSPAHMATMAGVAEAYHEAGPQYAAAAREGDRPRETT